MMSSEAKGRREMRVTAAAGTAQDSFCECRLCTKWTGEEWDVEGRCEKVETWD